MTDDLRRRVVRALGASSVSNLLAKIVSLTSTLVLARLLMPEDFGLMAMATTVTGFIAFFNEIGIGSAIVQRTEVSEEEINGCFGIALLASTVLALVVLGLSFPAADFFNMPSLQPVLAVLGFGFCFGGLNTVPVAMLRRQLRFQAVLWLGVTASIVQALVAIPLALLGFGYWALVGSFFIGQTIVTLWYWRASQWRPHWPIRLSKGRSLLSYGLDITYTRVLWHAYMNLDKLIVGKLLGERAVGVYDVSRSLASLPTSQITGMVVSVASPVYAKLQQDLPRLQAVHMRLTRGIAYATFPLLTGLAVLAPELVQVLLGPNWLEAVVPLQLLCVSEIVATVSNLQAQVLISTGHVRRLVRFNTLCAVVIPVSIVIGTLGGGLVGVALAWAVTYPLLNLWLLRESLSICGMSRREFFAGLRAPAIGAALMVGVVLALHTALGPLALPALPVLILCAFAGAISYLGYLVYVDVSGLAEIHQVLADFGVPARSLMRWPFSRLSA